MKRNGIVSFWKFIFSVIVVIFHAQNWGGNANFILFKGGYLGVEFFFIVSGVLLASSIVKTWDNNTDNLGLDTFKFIGKKLKSFMPYVVIAYILLFPFMYKYNNYSFDGILSTIWEVLLLGEAGIKSSTSNVPIWYLSSMLLAMFVIYPLMRKFKKNYVYFIAPVVVVVGLASLSQLNYSVNIMEKWIGFTNYTTLRAFVELNIGVLIYFIIQKLRNINFTFLGRLCLTLVEWGCFIFTLLVIGFVNSPFRYDIELILILSIGICLIFSEKTLEYKLLSNKIIFYFERLSFSVYVFHSLSKRIVSIGFRNIGYVNKLTLYLGLTFIIAMIMLEIITYLQKKNYFIDKIKPLFIVKTTN